MFDAPVNAHNVPAGGVPFAEEAAGARPEVNHRRVGRGEADVVVGTVGEFKLTSGRDNPAMLASGGAASIAAGTALLCSKATQKGRTAR